MIKQTTNFKKWTFEFIANGDINKLASPLPCFDWLIWESQGTVCDDHFAGKQNHVGHIPNLCRAGALGARLIMLK